MISPALIRQLSLGVLALTFTTATNSTATAADTGDPAVRALVLKIVKAWESLDVAKVDPYYAKDSDLAFYDVAPLKYANWTEYRTGVQKVFFDPNKSLKFTVKDDLNVHRRGPLAWAVFTFGADVVSKEDKSAHLDGRWTMILERRGSGWTVVHEHVSVPMGGP